MKALEILKKLERKMLNITQWDVEEAIIEIEAMQEHNKEWFIKIITLTKQSDEYKAELTAKDEEIERLKIAFDTPKANNMNFCPQCGGKLIEIDLRG